MLTLVRINALPLDTLIRTRDGALRFVRVRPGKAGWVRVREAHDGVVPVGEPGLRVFQLIQRVLSNEPLYEGGITAAGRGLSSGATDAVVIVHLSSIDSYREHGGDEAAVLRGIESLARTSSRVVVIDQGWLSKSTSAARSAVRRAAPNAVWVRHDELEDGWDTFDKQLPKILRGVKSVKLGGFWLSADGKDGCVAHVRDLLRKKGVSVVVSKEAVGIEPASHASGSSRGLAAGNTTSMAVMRRVIEICEDVRRRVRELEDRPGFDPSTAHGTYRAIFEVRLLRDLREVEGLQEGFRQVMRDYKLAPKARRVVVEAAKIIDKKQIRFPGGPESVRPKLFEFVDGLQAGATACLVALEQDDCPGNECATAGCFKVVNTAGFDAKVMARAHKLVDEASHIVAARGFSEVCYGKVFVTELIKSDARSLAFYNIDTDLVYVRAKPRKGDEAIEVESIVHELGHRYDHKFLGSEGRRKYEAVYAEWKRRFQRSDIDRSHEHRVVPGFRFPIKGMEFEVYDVSPGGSVSYRLIENHRVRKTVPMDFFLSALFGAKRTDDPFPSDYAKTATAELFAELFAASLLGKATVEQRVAFEIIVGRRMT